MSRPVAVLLLLAVSCGKAVECHSNGDCPPDRILCFWDSVDTCSSDGGHYPTVVIRKSSCAAVEEGHESGWCFQIATHTCPPGCTPTNCGCVCAICPASVDWG